MSLEHWFDMRAHVTSTVEPAGLLTSDQPVWLKIVQAAALGFVLGLAGYGVLATMLTLEF